MPAGQDPNTREGSPFCEVVLLVRLRPGDQVMLDPRSIEAGEMVSAGSQLLDAAVRQALPPVAAQGRPAPAIALGEVQRAGDLLGIEQRVDGVVLDDRGIAGVVQVEVETGGQIERLPMVPPEGGGDAAAALLLPAVRRRIRSTNRLSQLVLAARPRLDIAVGVPVEPAR